MRSHTPLQSCLAATVALFATLVIVIPSVGCTTADCTVKNINVSLVDTNGKPLDIIDCEDAKVTYSQDSVSADMRYDYSDAVNCVFIQVDNGLDGPPKVHDAKPVKISVTPGAGSMYAAQTVTGEVDHCGGSLIQIVTMKPAATM